MPIVAAQLRNLVPAACVQFTWSSETGRLTNFWADTLMPRRTAWIILNHKRYEADAGISFRDLALYGTPTGNLRVWWERGFDRSATYAAVFEPYGLHWFLDGVVRDATRPYGVLALIRRREDADFSAREEAIVGQILPYLAHALRVQETRPTIFVRSGRSALVVCDADGRVVEWSERAHRLAVYALLDEINLDARIGAQDFVAVQAAITELAGELRGRIEGGSDELPAIHRRNGWGEFVFRGYLLDSKRLGILIEQQVPLESHLLERVNRLPLTARQKDVVLLAARGLPNADIAARLTISPHTLKEYLKDIYARLHINSHQRLMECLMERPRWPAAAPPEE